MRSGRRSLLRFLDIHYALIFILVVGAAFLVIDAMSQRQPVRGNDHYQRIGSFVQSELDASRIPGAAVAIVEGDSVTYASGFGEDGRGHVITEDTPFWIGSNTKSFTALAVRQLAEAGRIDLDAPVQRYLTDFRIADQSSAARITVRHLLNQTSGFSRSDGLRPVMEERSETIQEAVARLAEVELNRPVGESYQYSNLNFMVLGLLVERVSGMSWQDYVQRNILTPAGMTRTYTDPAAARAAGLTDTHRVVFGFPIESDVAYLEGLAPTGYLFSTASDMARYLSMYLQGGTIGTNQVLSSQGIGEMLRSATNAASVRLQSQTFEARYGEGWFVGPFGPAADARWHQGSLPQFTAWMILLPQTNQAVVVLINTGNQFDLLAANSVFSRIPIGIVQVLRGETPAAGLSLTRFYIVFNAMVASILTLQVWSLQRLARGRGAAMLRQTQRSLSPFTRRKSRALFFTPLIWELGLASLLLVGFPSTIGASWTAALRFIPDLSLVILAIALLWLVTGLTRLVILFREGRKPDNSGKDEEHVELKYHTAAAGRRS